MHVGLTQRTVAGAHEESRDALDQRWCEFVELLGMVPVPIPTYIRDVHQYVDDLKIRGLVLTGGDDLGALSPRAESPPRRDSLEERAFRLARRRKIPTLGICRGFQLAVLLDGGAVELTEGHVGTTHALWLQAHSKLLPKRVHSYHNWAVTRLPTTYRALAKCFSPVESVEAATDESGKFLGLMWHPERHMDNAEACTELIVNHLESRT